MKYEDVNTGQTVWITGGTDKGRQGTVEDKGWGAVRVTLPGSETKIFDSTSLTDKDPNSHNVPLPPNFIPSEFKVGDLVEVSGHSVPSYNGIKGKITRLPTSTTYRNGGDRRYEVEVTGKDHSCFSVGSYLYFEAKMLKKYVKRERIEGYEISHEEVEIGDIIRVELRSSKGGFSQFSNKEGKVSVVAKKLHLTGITAEDYTFRTAEGGGWSAVLNYNHKDEKIILVKAAEDPYVAILNGLTAGTVVVDERTNGEVLTYVKSMPFASAAQWHKVSSFSKYSSTFVDDRDILELLNNGAEIVHKVRKPKPPVADVNVPF